MREAKNELFSLRRKTDELSMERALFLEDILAKAKLRFLLQGLQSVSKTPRDPSKLDATETVETLDYAYCLQLVRRDINLRSSERMVRLARERARFRREGIDEIFEEKDREKEVAYEEEEDASSAPPSRFNSAESLSLSSSLSLPTFIDHQFDGLDEETKKKKKRRRRKTTTN